MILRERIYTVETVLPDFTLEVRDIFPPKSV